MALFTVTYDKIVNKLIAPAVIGYNGKYKAVHALFDTGATVTYVSENIVTELSLIPTGEFIGTKALKETQVCPIVKANIGFPKNNIFKDWEVASTRKNNPDFDILIGMDIISRGDFAISNYNGHTTFTLRIPSQEETKYSDYIVSEDDIPALIKMMQHL